jgi:pimeloyl-ACP methyl ester carboxylesterase
MRSPHRPHRERRVPVARGRQLGAAEFGDPSGFPVLWFHGTPGGRMQVPPDAPAESAARGIRLIGVERPGTGDSTNHRYRAVRELADDVRAFADELGLARFAIIGLSGGGPYALACAHDLPHRVAVVAVLGGIGPVAGPDAVPGHGRLLSALHSFAEIVAAPVGFVLPTLVRPLAPFAHQAVRAFSLISPPDDRPILLDPAFESVLVGDILHVMDGGLAALLHDFRLLSTDWGFRLRDVRVPIEVLHGTRDDFVPAAHGRHVASSVADGRFTAVDGGHLAGYVNAARVFDVLAPHLARARAGDVAGPR